MIDKRKSIPMSILAITLSLTYVLIVFKTLQIITISWFWVFCPLWLGVAGGFIALVITLMALAIYGRIKGDKKNEDTKLEEKG